MEVQIFPAAAALRYDFDFIASLKKLLNICLKKNQSDRILTAKSQMKGFRKNEADERRGGTSLGSSSKARAWWTNFAI